MIYRLFSSVSEPAAVAVGFFERFDDRDTGLANRVDDHLRHPVAAPEGVGRFTEVDGGDFDFAAVVGILS
jgi:hypothetical protein